MPRRSRGCRECRQKRLGCDGNLPSCLRCIQNNIPCSGPLQGPIIIDQTKQIASRFARERPMSRQPSPRAIESLAYVAGFISNATAIIDAPLRSTPWLRRLGVAYLEEESSPLSLSFEAIAIAYCGSSIKNHSAVMEGCRLYGEAMIQHAKTISQQSSSAPSPAMIYTSVLLSLFEAVWTTESAAYTTHLAAAQEMIASVEWGSTGEYEMLRQIALHVQLQTFFLMIVSSQDSRAGRITMKGWTDALRDNCSKSNDMGDNALSLVFSLVKLVSNQELEAGSSTAQLRVFDSLIDDAWAKYQAEATLNGEVIQFYTVDGIEYRDGQTALVVAYLATARFILSLARYRATEKVVNMIQQSCQEILDCAAFLYRVRFSIGCAYVAICVPVTLVALQGTLEEHKISAYTFLSDHFQGTPFEGLRSMAVKRIETVGSYGRFESQSVFETATRSWLPVFN